LIICREVNSVRLTLSLLYMTWCLVPCLRFNLPTYSQGDNYMCYFQGDNYRD
jgi:hypothetical protein